MPRKPRKLIEKAKELGVEVWAKRIRKGEEEIELVAFYEPAGVNTEAKGSNEERDTTIQTEFKFTIVGRWVRLDLRIEGNSAEKLQDLFMDDYESFLDFLAKFFNDWGDFRCADDSYYFDPYEYPDQWLNLGILWAYSNQVEVYTMLMDHPLDKIAKFEKWVNTTLKPILASLNKLVAWKKFVEKQTTSNEEHTKIEIP
jgi:hypothetical protein